MHALIAVLIDGISRGDITSEDVDRIAAVKKLVDEMLTCCFDDPDDENDKDYGWHPETSDSPKVNIPEIYAEDVRREMFSSGMDFRLDENHKMVSEVTRRKFYQFQLRNQVHFCTHTCWKHKHSTQRGKVCRFHYPIPQESVSAVTSTIAHSLDWRNRKQVKILPPRNNAWLNALPKHPLLVFAAQGNMMCSMFPMQLALWSIQQVTLASRKNQIAKNRSLYLSKNCLTFSQERRETSAIGTSFALQANPLWLVNVLGRYNVVTFY